MSLRRLVLPLLVCLTAGLTLAPPASAATHRHAHGGYLRCVRVDATGVGQDLGEGQTSATISVHGHEIGTTAAAFTITGTDGAVASFTGPIVFTGLGGTLTAHVTGTLDGATGAFTSTSTSLSGTGVFRHVTGELIFTGTEDLASRAFTESITGELCRAHRHGRGHGH